MPINSKQKGARGEREVRDLLIRFGYDARRGQQFAGNPDSPDVISNLEGIHIEAKFVESLNLYKAFEQAERDCGGKCPTVWHRKTRSPWLITMKAEDFLAMLTNFPKV